MDVIRADGVFSTDIPGVVAELRARGAGITEKAIFHIAISAAPGERWGEDEQRKAVAALLKEYDLDGQPVLVVRHMKDRQEVGRSAHLHVVASRVRDTGRVISDSWTRVRNEKISRCLERELGHALTVGRHNRAVMHHLRKAGRADVADWMEQQAAHVALRPTALLTHADAQQETRTKIKKLSAAAEVLAAFRQADSGRAFEAALAERGYRLARGRESIMVVDPAGGAHDVARLLRAAMKAQGEKRSASAVRAEIEAKLKDLDISTLPELAAAQAAAREGDEPTPSGPVPQQGEHSWGATDEGATDGGAFDVDAILDRLTRDRATFTEGDLGRELRKTLPGKASRTAALKEILGRSDVMTVALDERGQHRLTTRAMAEVEAGILDRTAALAARTAFAISDDAVSAGIRAFSEAFLRSSGHELMAEQIAAIRHVTAGADIATVAGFAGAGKSTMMEGAARIWTGAGYRLEGMALSGIAAVRLAEAGITSDTIAARLMKWDRIAALADLRDSGQFTDPSRDAVARALDGWRDAAARRGEATAGIEAMRSQVDRAATVADLDRSTRRWLSRWTRRHLADDITGTTVLVIDEAGMVNHKIMNRILAHAHRVGAKVVAVGDAEQIQPIDAGAAFRIMQKIAAPAELREVIRQAEKWQRQATANFASGDPDRAAAAVEAYASHGLVHAGIGADPDDPLDGRSGARQQLFAAWRRDLEADGPERSRIILAYTRADVARLNQAARSAMRHAGHLVGDDADVETEVDGVSGTLAVAVGDRVMTLANDKKFGVQNGSTGRVVAIDRTEGSAPVVTVRVDDGRVVAIDTAAYKALTHAYAATIHKSQGVTVDRTWVLAHPMMDRHLAYVAMSRHREQVQLFAAAEDASTVADLGRLLGRARSKDAIVDYVDPRRVLRDPDSAMVPMRQAIGQAANAVRALGDQLQDAVTQVIARASGAVDAAGTHLAEAKKRFPALDAVDHDRLAAFADLYDRYRKISADTQSTHEDRAAIRVELRSMARELSETDLAGAPDELRRAVEDRQEQAPPDQHEEHGPSMS